MTRYKDTAVVENVKECVDECEEPLGGYGSARTGRQQAACRPVCSTVKKTVHRPLPDTVCEKIPFEVRESLIMRVVLFPMHVLYVPL